LSKAVFDYEATGEVPDFSDDLALKIAFEQTRNQLDIDREKYLATCKARAEAGKMGGAPKGNQNARKDKNKQNQAKQADNEYDNEYDTDDEYVNDNENEYVCENESGAGPEDDRYCGKEDPTSDTGAIDAPTGVPYYSEKEFISCYMKYRDTLTHCAVDPRQAPKLCIELRYDPNWQQTLLSRMTG